MTEITTIPPATDKVWADVVTGKITVSWQMLALKIMMTRILSQTRNAPPDKVAAAAQELHAFFQKNIKLAQADLAAVLKR